MKIGDKIECVPETFGGAITTGNNALRQRFVGTVVYIHPRNRYYTVEFAFPCGKVRESFSCSHR